MSDTEKNQNSSGKPDTSGLDQISESTKYLLDDLDRKVDWEEVHRDRLRMEKLRDTEGYKRIKAEMESKGR